MWNQVAISNFVLKNTISKFLTILIQKDTWENVKDGFFYED